MLNTQRPDIVGPDDATKAIVTVYDIFGVWPQTIQGADLLSSLTGALVLVPDFFEGDGAKPEWLPANTPEKQKALGDFFASKAGFDNGVEALLRVRKDLATRYPAVDEHVGVFGLCWGGKVGVLATGAGNEGPGRRFNVSGTAHPGYVFVLAALASLISFLAALASLFSFLAALAATFPRSLGLHC